MRYCRIGSLLAVALVFVLAACKKTSSPGKNPNPNPSSSCLLTGVTFNNAQVVDSQSIALNYDDQQRIVQYYSNPGAVTAHVNYLSDGKIGTIVYSSTPNIDTIIYDGKNLAALITMGADGTPLDTLIFSYNDSGWVADVKENLRLNRLSPSIYGHLTYAYEAGQLQSIYQSIDNVESPEPTSVYLPNNLPVQDPTNPFAANSRENLFLLYRFFGSDALGSAWTVGNIQLIQYTTGGTITYEQKYQYTLDSSGHVIHRDALLAKDAPSYSNFSLQYDNNYSYTCK